MADPLTPKLPDADVSPDENLQLKQQANDAAATSDQLPIPAPPPLPGTGTLAGGATAAPSTANDVSPSIPTGTSTMPSATPSSPSQIFANDPSRPGAGYVMVNGVPTRIEGTTAAGKDVGGASPGYDAKGNPVVTAQDRYILDGGVLGDFINPDDYYNFIGAYHPPDNPSLAAAAPTPSVDSGAGGLGGLFSQYPVTGDAPSSGLGGLSAQYPITGAAPSSGLGGLFNQLPPTGSASDVGTPSSGVGATMGSATPIGTPPGTTAGGPYTDADVQIGSTILPNADPRLRGTQSMVDAAAQGVANVDREKLAESMFDTFQKSTDPAYQASIRRATQAAAGAGRIGSGQLRTTYGDLALQRGRDLDLARRSLLDNAIEGSISDSFNKLGALSGLEGQQFGEGYSNRNELRGERGYQGSLEEQAFQRALQQYLLEKQDVADRFQRGVSTQQLGEQGNPADYLARISSQYQFDPSLILALAGSLGKQSQGSSSTGGLSIPSLPIPGLPTGTQPTIPIANDPLFPPGTLPA